MFDLKVLQLKEEIIKLINESGLPASILVYVIKDIADLAETTLREQVQAQLAEQQQQAVVMDDTEEK